MQPKEFRMLEIVTQDEATVTPQLPGIQSRR